MRIIFFVVAISFSFSSHSNELAKGYAVSNNAQACQAFVSSEICQKYQGKPGALKPEQCQADVTGANWSVMSRLGNCASGFKMSAQDMWEVAKGIGSGIGSGLSGIYNYLTDSDSRAATHESVKEALKTSADYLESVYPYVMMEFQKNYDSISKESGHGGMTSLRAAQSIAPQLMGKIMSVALEVIKAKYKEFHCFDNNKQVEMICRVAGDLLVPPTGILAAMKYGTKGLAATPAVAKKISEFLDLGAKGINYEQKAEDVLDKVDKAKQGFEKSVEKLQELGRKGQHTVTQENGVGVLKIGYLEKRDRSFMVETARQIKEGTIKKVDAGQIVGPKVLPTMMDFGKRVGQESGSVQFRGSLNGSRIKTSFEDQVRAAVPAAYDSGRANPYHWSSQEIENYRRAYAEMGIDEACRKYYRSQPCGDLSFEFDAKNPQRIVWRKGR